MNTALARKGRKRQKKNSKVDDDKDHISVEPMHLEEGVNFVYGSRSSDNAHARVSSDNFMSPWTSHYYHGEKKGDDAPKGTFSPKEGGGGGVDPAENGGNKEGENKRLKKVGKYSYSIVVYDALPYISVSIFIIVASITIPAMGWLIYYESILPRRERRNIRRGMGLPVGKRPRRSTGSSYSSRRLSDSVGLVRTPTRRKVVKRPPSGNAPM